MKNDINSYDTNAIGDVSVINNLNLEWLDNVSDHFMVKFNVNKKINNLDDINTTWRLNSNNWSEYNDILQYLVRDINEDSIKKYTVNDLTQYLTKSIRFCCKTTIGIKKYTSNSNDWINKDILTVKNLTKKYRRKNEKLKKKGKFSDKLNKLYNYCKRIRNKMVKIARNMSWYKHGNEMNDNVNDSKTFFKLRDRVLGENKKDLPSFRKEDGTYTDDNGKSENDAR